MLKSNHYNLYTGIGEKLKLYKEKVYRLRPNVQNEFVDEKYNCIAKRLTVPLEQDAVYKTQFFNEMLACALQPLNNDTQFILYNVDGKIENPYKYLPTLSEDYASIICQIEPEKPFTEISIVIYCGPDINKILLSDGSVTMDADYVPTKDTDVITKEYADRLIENFTAFSYPLKHFTIKQGNVGPIGAYCFLDNSFYDKVLFIRNHNTILKVATGILIVLALMTTVFISDKQKGWQESAKDETEDLETLKKVLPVSDYFQARQQLAQRKMDFSDPNTMLMAMP